MGARVLELVDQLDLPSLGLRSRFIKELKEFRTRYPRGRTFVDITDGETAKELRAMTEEFLIQRNRGNVFWPPRDPCDQELQYSRDKDLICQKLGELIVQQNLNRQNNVRYGRVGQIAGSSEPGLDYINYELRSKACRSLPDTKDILESDVPIKFVPATSPKKLIVRLKLPRANGSLANGSGAPSARQRKRKASISNQAELTPQDKRSRSERSTIEPSIEEDDEGRGRRRSLRRSKSPVNYARSGFEEYDLDGPSPLHIGRGLSSASDHSSRIGDPTSVHSEPGDSSRTLSVRHKPETEGASQAKSDNNAKESQCSSERRNPGAPQQKPPPQSRATKHARTRKAANAVASSGSGSTTKPDITWYYDITTSCDGEGLQVIPWMPSGAHPLSTERFRDFLASVYLAAGTGTDAGMSMRYLRLSVRSADLGLQRIPMAIDAGEPAEEEKFDRFKTSVRRFLKDKMGAVRAALRRGDPVKANVVVELQVEIAFSRVGEQQQRKEQSMTGEKEEAEEEEEESWF